LKGGSTMAPGRKVGASSQQLRGKQTPENLLKFLSYC